MSLAVSRAMPKADRVRVSSRGPMAAGIAHGSGNADREVVDGMNRVAVPPEDPQYTLRRVWMTEEQEKGFSLS